MAVPIDSRIAINNSCNDVTCCCCLWPKKENNTPKLSRKNQKKLEMEQKKTSEAAKVLYLKDRTMETYD
jgi:aconitase A